MTLSKHLMTEHDMTTKEYALLYGITVCESHSQQRRDQEKEKHKDPIAYELWLLQHAEKISNGIMTSPSARIARQENMRKWTTSDAGRKVASDTAKITSAREDIIKNRSANLAKWRKDYPDEFYDKCTAKMNASWHSMPEIVLFEFVKVYNQEFKINQQIKRVNSFLLTKSRRRQIDICDKTKKIVIEFDGPRHFLPINGEDVLKNSIAKDKELNIVLVSEDFCVIRVAYDQFIYKSTKNFTEECLTQVTEIIKQNKPGLYLIGEAYKGSTVG